MTQKYIDENGYERGKLEHTDLIHRQKAYRDIYLKHREDYPLPFNKYVIHHKDGDKRNNNISNLKIITQEEHEQIHGISKNKKLTNYENETSGYLHKSVNPWETKKSTENIITKPENIFLIIVSIIWLGITYQKGIIIFGIIVFIAFFVFLYFMGAFE